MIEKFSEIFMRDLMVTTRVVGARDPTDPMVDPPLLILDGVVDVANSAQSSFVAPTQWWGGERT